MANAYSPANDINLHFAFSESSVAYKYVPFDTEFKINNFMAAICILVALHFIVSGCTSRGGTTSQTFPRAKLLIIVCFLSPNVFILLVLQDIQ